jgi:hypothetical protein
MESSPNVDTGKRSKLLFLSFLITSGIFVVKMTQLGRLELWQVLLIALGSAIITILGLIFAFNFVLNKKTAFVIIPQSALFVFSEVLFLELFFFEKFDRVYEALILFALLGFLFIGTYASFLAANVLSVSSFKQIPLEQAAKTTSYILSLLMIFFLTFSVLTAEFPFIFIIVILAIIYFVILLSYSSLLKFPENYFYSVVMTAGWSMLISTVAVSFLGSRAEIVSLVPTAVMFAILGIYINKFEQKLQWNNILEYVFIVLVVFIVNFYLRG